MHNRYCLNSTMTNIYFIFSSVQHVASLQSIKFSIAEYNLLNIARHIFLLKVNKLSDLSVAVEHRLLAARLGAGAQTLVRALVEHLH